MVVPARNPPPFGHLPCKGGFGVRRVFWGYGGKNRCQGWRQIAAPTWYYDGAYTVGTPLPRRPKPTVFEGSCVIKSLSVHRFKALCFKSMYFISTEGFLSVGWVGCRFCLRATLRRYAPLEKWSDCHRQSGMEIASLPLRREPIFTGNRV